MSSTKMGGIAPTALSFHVQLSENVVNAALIAFNGNPHVIGPSEPVAYQDYSTGCAEVPA